MSKTLVIGNESSNFIQIDVLNYEQAPSADPFDSNWLDCRVSVSCDAWKGKRYSVSLQASDFKEFQGSASRLEESLKGDAVFSTMEEQIEFKLIGNGKGGIEVNGRAISRHVPRCALQFTFEIDQTYLPKILEQLQSIILAFPVR